VNRAVILARGLGRRMRQAEPHTVLEAAQESAAAKGIKGMIPVGRPFLDYVLSALADAGFDEVCLVIGPEHQSVRDYYGAPGRLSRIAVTYAIQEEPRGTADAVRAAEYFAGGRPFLVCNADNYYPTPVLAALGALTGPGLAGFAPGALVGLSNIPAARVAQFALLAETPDGFLADIVEKPDAGTIARLGPRARVSMNAWAFGPEIFEACRHATPSARGELELQDAVRYAIRRLGTRFRVLPVEAGVLDLSYRGDIATVAEHLVGVEVRL
jgi:glucose-1-phosphate thymidylyltransferase